MASASLLYDSSDFDSDLDYSDSIDITSAPVVDQLTTPDQSVLTGGFNEGVTYSPTSLGANPPASPTSGIPSSTTQQASSAYGLLSGVSNLGASLVDLLAFNPTPITSPKVVEVSSSGVKPGSLSSLFQGNNGIILIVIGIVLFAIFALRRKF